MAIAVVEVDAAGLVREIGVVRARRVPAGRRRLVGEVIREAVRRTIERHPVETAEARSAWVAALEDLGGAPPPGWEGATPDGEAIAEGRTRGTTSRTETGSRTEQAATNGVKHVIFLEYGTRKMAPREMVRRSLEEVHEMVAQGAFGGVLE